MATPQYGGAPPAARPNHRQDNHWLEMRQEPEKARVVVRGKEKDRKPVDPPPIVQLKVQDPYNDTCSFLHNPYYFCTCTLWEADTDAPKKQDSTPGATPPELLQGQLVSSLHRLKDFDNTEQGFFVFSDISVGIMGKFRLRFSLYEYRPTTNDTVFLKEMLSKVFEVVAPKDWDGVRESTALSRSFADQGVRIRLRKESRHSSKRPYQNQQGQNLAPQTPLRPHPAQQGSYSAGGEEASGMESGEPPYKRQRSFPGQAQGYNMAPAQQQQNWQQQQSGYPAIPQQQGMYRDQNTGQMYGQGPYYNAPAPYGQYPAQQPNQAAFMPQAGYGSNGSTPQGQQQQYANAQQRGQYVQNAAQNYNANTYNNQAYANLAQRYPSQGNQYGSPQAGQATVPSNYQQSPYGTGSPYATNQQTPGQQGQQGQQGRAPYFNQAQQGGQYTASGQPSPAQPMGQMANASNTPRLKQLNTAVAQHNDVVDPAMHHQHLQQRAGES